MWAYGEQYQSMLIQPDTGNDCETEEAENPVWLNGPASYWYMNHPNLIQKGKFNYGFKKKTVNYYFYLIINDLQKYFLMKFVHWLIKRQTLNFI